MKNKTLFAASLALMMAMPMQAQKFEDNFEDKTLRLDYIVAGDSVKQAIYFEQAYSNPTWAGRRPWRSARRRRRSRPRPSGGRSRASARRRSRPLKSLSQPNNSAVISRV